MKILFQFFYLERKDNFNYFVAIFLRAQRALLKKNVILSFFHSYTFQLIYFLCAQNENYVGIFFSRAQKAHLKNRVYLCFFHPFTFQFLYFSRFPLYRNVKSKNYKNLFFKGPKSSP